MGKEGRRYRKFKEVRRIGVLQMMLTADVALSGAEKLHFKT